MPARLLFLFLPLLSAAQTVELRGAYSSPKPFWDKGAQLGAYGINAIFVHGGSLTPELVTRARAEGARVYAEFATLNGKGYVEKHAEAWPVNEKGEKAPAATWFMGACPTEAGFRAYRMKQLDELLDRVEIDGVWMDYLHWHAQFEDPDPVLPETCFSDSCLTAFAKDKGVKLPGGDTAARARWILERHEREWRDWRASVLVSWAQEIRERLNRKRPGMLLGNFQCPWSDADFGGARRRILGLDVKRMARVVDVFSPMVYHGRMGRAPEWVGEASEWLARQIGAERGRFPKIWPIVQAHNDPGAISAEEFGRVLRLGASGRSSGVMMFTLGSVAADPAKMQVLRDTYRGWAGR
jgi:hypothetical protein